MARSAYSVKPAQTRSSRNRCRSVILPGVKMCVPIFSCTPIKPSYRTRNRNCKYRDHNYNKNGIHLCICIRSSIFSKRCFNAQDYWKGGLEYVHCLETATRNNNIIDQKTSIDSNDFVTSKDIGGVALDDVKNCLGELPFIQYTLARYYSYHYPIQGGTGSGATAFKGVYRGADQYKSNRQQKRQKEQGVQEKVEDLNYDGSTRGANRICTAATTFENSRLLMEFVDFLQLFIPITLSDDATPTTVKTERSIAVNQDGNKNDDTSYRATNSVHDDRKCRPSNNDSSSSNCDNCGEDEDGTEAHQERVMNLMDLQKRVAHASARVRSYVNAMIVVHQGWRLDVGTSSVEMEDSRFAGGNNGDSGQNNETKEKDNLADDSSRGLKRRFTFDNDESNMLHDDVAANEYYGTFFPTNVQRDATRCKSTGAIDSTRHFNPYHAFSLVGCHAFDLSTVESYNSDGSNKGTYTIEPWVDPVASIPSLRRIIKKNDHLEFFVWAVFMKGGWQRRQQGKENGHRILKVVLFVRNLPSLGRVNEKFDRAYDSFKSGDIDYREQKFKLFLQLCPSPSLSPFSLAAVKVISFFLNFGKRSKTQIPFPNSVGFYASASLPGISLSKFSTTRHFGGSLQTNKTLPNNYIATTSQIDASSMTTFPCRIMYNRFGVKEYCSNVIDFTLSLEGDKEEERVDRFLGAIRIVHFDYSSLLPPSFIVKKEEGPAVALCSLCECQDSEEAEKGTQNFSTSDEGHGDANDVEVESDNEAESPIKSGIASLKFILRGITVPVRKCNLANMTAGDEIDDTSSVILRGPNSVWKEDMIDFSVLQSLSDSDFERFYVAADLNLEKAAVRIIESVAWRGITFPIDTRTCRTELQLGQFFRQGVDLENNPVFYFRNMSLGHWRNDIESIIFATLHRFEIAAQELNEYDEKFKCTLIIIWKPIGGIAEDVSKENASEEEAKEKKEENKGVHGSRIDPWEDNQVHKNFTLVRRLRDIFSKHYPERLSKALIVSSGGWEKTLGTVGLRAYVPAARTRSRVVMLNSPDDLKKYVSKDEFVTLVGGNATVRPEAFEI